MADERIDIKITDSISPSIQKKLIGIAKSADKADSSIERLQKQLNSLNVQSLNKLSTAQARMANATARLTNAQTRQNVATSKQLLTSSKLAIQEQKLAAATQRSAASAASAAAARSRAAAASSRAATAALRHQQAVLKAANAQSRAGRTALNWRGSLLSLRGVLTTLLPLYGIRELVRLSDEYVNLTNRLRFVTDSQEQLADVSQRVKDIARDSRAPVLEIATAFQRFDLALGELGASQEESLKFTETLAKATTLAGLTTIEQTQSIRQLSQALNKGKLDGDEFRTVMETLPIVARAIAKEMGVAKGELQELAPQGKITAEVLRNAIAASADDVTEAFSKLTPTVAQAGTVLRNSLGEAIDDFNKATGASEILANGIIFLADNIGTMAKVLATATPILIVYVSTLNIGIVNAFRNGIVALTVAIAAQGGVIAFTTGAWARLNLVILANPIIATAVAITTIVIAIKVWGDATEELTDRQTDLKKELDRVTDAQKRLAAVSSPEENLADAVIKLVAELEKEGELLLLTNRERKARIKLDKALAAAGASETNELLIPTLQAVLRNQIAINDALKDQARVLDNLRNPVETYKANLDAIIALTLQGIITLEEANRQFEQLALVQDLQKVQQFTTGDQESNELQQLAAEQNRRLQILENARRADIIGITQLEDEKTALTVKGEKERSRIQAESTQRQLQGAAALAGGLSQLAAAFADDQSRKNKALFRVAKALALAEAGINIATGISKALNNPYPANLGFAASVAAQGAVIISQLKSNKFADGGIVRGPGGPRDDLINAQLSNGEFVVRAEAVNSNRALLEAINTSNRPVSLDRFTPREAQGPSGGAPPASITRTISPSAPQVNVNVNTLPGTRASVQTSRQGADTRIDISIEEIDAALASNLSNGRGAFSAELNDKISRQF